jgi:hypothetical protein
LPKSQLPTVLSFSFGTLFSPVSFHVSSVRPLLLNTCAMFTRSMPLSRDDMRLDSQSIPNWGLPPATTAPERCSARRA